MLTDGVARSAREFPRKFSKFFLTRVEKCLSMSVNILISQ